MLLVTEFPPPPFYYGLASSTIPAASRLKPPEIPHRAFRIAAKKVALERRRAKEESDRIRSAAVGEGGAAIPLLAGASAAPGEGKDGAKTDGEEEDDDLEGVDINDPNAPVVAVFGEIVEDPTLTQEEECDDPTLIRKNVEDLNQRVLRGFLNVVQKLVHEPTDNKKLRDELSHDIFLMLQECNKFREHQARELLISTLERQLEHRDRGLRDLREQIEEADRSLGALEEFRKTEGAADA